MTMRDISGSFLYVPRTFGADQTHRPGWCPTIHPACTVRIPFPRCANWDIEAGRTRRPLPPVALAARGHCTRDGGHWKRVVRSRMRCGGSCSMQSPWPVHCHLRGVDARRWHPGATPTASDLRRDRPQPARADEDPADPVLASRRRRPAKHVSGDLCTSHRGYSFIPDECTSSESLKAAIPPVRLFVCD